MAHPPGFHALEEFGIWASLIISFIGNRVSPPMIMPFRNSQVCSKVDSIFRKNHTSVCKRDQTLVFGAPTIEVRHLQHCTSICVPRRRRSTSYAVVTSSDCLDRGWFSALGGEWAHSYATNHEVNIERGGSRLRSFVALECFWNFAFSFPDSGWALNREFANCNLARWIRSG
jgi:hypothetical protein